METRWPAIAGEARRQNATKTRDALPRRLEHNRAQFHGELSGMPRIILEITVATLLTIGAIISLAAGAVASDVMVMNAFARASATPVAKSGAAYLTIMNHGSEPDRLIGVSADIARVANIHQATEENGVASMRAVDELEIAPHSEQALAPGGMHIMLFDLKQPLKEGAHFKLILQFERAGEVSVDVPVGGVAAGSDEHAGHGTDSGN
jgi:copper(I)-binding protein